MFFFFPSPIIGTFYGKQYLVNASLLGLYGLAMTLYSLVNVWLFYYLAVHEKRYSYVLLLGAILLLASLTLFGSTPTQVVTVLVGGGLALCLGGELLLLVRRRSDE